MSRYSAALVRNFAHVAERQRTCAGNEFHHRSIGLLDCLVLIQCIKHARDHVTPVEALLKLRGWKEVWRLVVAVVDLPADQVVGAGRGVVIAPRRPGDPALPVRVYVIPTGTTAASSRRRPGRGGQSVRSRSAGRMSPPPSVFVPAGIQPTVAGGCKEIRFAHAGGVPRDADRRPCQKGAQNAEGHSNGGIDTCV